MSKNTTPIWIPAFRQGLALLFISAILAMVVNQIRPDGIKIVGDWSVEARLRGPDGESMIVSLEEARELYDLHEAIFIDARSEEHYHEGHIKGALSLPWQRVHEYFIEVAEQLDPGKPIITYCDGETCELSHELAIFLKDMGFNNSRVLVNGWGLWLESGLPVISGVDAGGE